MDKKSVMYNLAQAICGKIPGIDQCHIRCDPGGFHSLEFEHDELGPSIVTALLYPGGAVAGAELGGVTIPMEQYDLPADQVQTNRDYLDEKDIFVSWLKPLVILCDRSVKDLQYIPNHPTWIKAVRIVYKDHCQDICINGSSYLWIAKHVFEALEY